MEAVIQTYKYIIMKQIKIVRHIDFFQLYLR